jgi:HD-GYP domain-containing protein (c-di-GMP phosphodiesterase class II)
MNIAMTELQDQLAQQSQPLTAQQIVAVEDHASRSEQLLRRLGVADPVWLEAVLCHHHRLPGPLAKKSEAQQMARLLQRADIFGARLAPRVARSPMPVTAAMQASYYDEEHQVDEAGAALVKTLGVYPPGAFVRLITQEVAVVLRRGATATTPRVAVVMNRDGMPTGEMIPRDTSQAAWKIAGVVAYRDVRVQLPLDRLLALV